MGVDQPECGAGRASPAKTVEYEHHWQKNTLIRSLHAVAGAVQQTDVYMMKLPMHGFPPNSPKGRPLRRGRRRPLF
jgi:hypothetical protein